MSIKQRRRRGFTLIELVVVLVILIALAALVIPRLSFIGEQAGNAAAATGAGQLASNIEVYRTTTGSYPLGLDTLIDDSGALYSKLWVHAAPPFGPGLMFEAATLEDGTGESYIKSFGHGWAPSETTSARVFYDHDSAETDVDSSATVTNTLALDGTDTLCFVKTPPPFPASAADAVHIAFIKKLGYPTGAIPAGVKLVVFGVGPSSGLIGSTMMSAPRHSEQETGTYARYFAVFAIYSSGKAAQLKGVFDSQGVSIDGNISSYLEEAVVHE